MEKSYNIIQPEKGVPIKAWTKGVAIEAVAEKQLRNVAAMPFIYRWVSAMPDVHWGIGATVGSVIPTKGALIPAAVRCVAPAAERLQSSYREVSEARPRQRRESSWYPWDRQSFYRSVPR